MTDEVAVPLGKVRSILDGYGSTLVAYSGGVDSAVVLMLAKQQLGDFALGIIGNSPAYPASELNEALTLARKFSLPVRMIETDESSDPRYLANTGDRCFFCRSHLFAQLRNLANKEGFAQVTDGVHADDLRDHVGGMKAARQFGVRSPLLEAGLGKADVRAIARELGLPVWDKPALACLASRIPSGTPVTLSLLNRIGQTEQSLRDLGFSNFRVRHHGDLARIELAEDEMPRALKLQSQLVAQLREAGYRHVTLDLNPRK